MLTCRVAALAAATFLLGTAALAQDSVVLRCGNHYTDQPCPNGQAVDVADSRSAAQQQQASQAARRDAALAEKMTAQRQAFEKSAARNQAVRIGPEPTKAAPKAPYRPPRRANRGKAVVPVPTTPAKP